MLDIDTPQQTSSYTLLFKRSPGLECRDHGAWSRSGCLRLIKVPRSSSLYLAPQIGKYDTLAEQQRMDYGESSTQNTATNSFLSENTLYHEGH